jgi:hypothetical protein
VGLYHFHANKTIIPDAHRLSMLARCLQTIRAWLDVYFNMPPATSASASFFIWCQMSHVTTSLYRLSVIEEPDWDKDLVRATVDLMEVMDKLIQRFSHVSAEAGLICDRPDGLDPYAMVVLSVRTIKSAWEMTVRPEGVGVGVLLPDGLGELDSFSTEFLEGINEWMSDMFVSWDSMVVGQESF